ncbi:MAG: SCO family protein [Fimbriimonadaceae bacterium]
MLRWLFCTLVVLVAAVSLAQEGWLTPEQVSDRIALEQRLGDQIELNVPFQDEFGRSVSLGQIFGQPGKAKLIVPIFHDCPSACPAITAGVLKALNDFTEAPVGSNFEVVVLNINPNEGPEHSRAAKEEWMQQYKVQGTEPHWHMLTGNYEDMSRVLESMGYRYYFNERTGQISHPSGVILATPDGRVSRYFYGAELPAKLLKGALAWAADGNIGVRAEPVFFGCFVPDPATGQYRANIVRIVQILGFATLFAAIGFGVFYEVRRKRSRLDESKAGQDSGSDDPDGPSES